MFKTVLIMVLVGVLSAIVFSIARYLFYPKIVKQVQRTVSELTSVTSTAKTPVSVASGANASDPTAAPSTYGATTTTSPPAA